MESVTNTVAVASPELELKILPAWENISQRIYAFILKKTQDPDLSKDILQEVFIKIYLKSEQIKSLEKVDSWIFQITRNLIIDHFRADAKNQKLKDNFSQEFESDITTDIELIDLTDCLMPFANQLPEKYRIAIILSDIEGKRQKYIAEHLGLSYSATKSRIQRARIMIRDLIKACCNFDLRKDGTLIWEADKVRQECNC